MAKVLWTQKQNIGPRPRAGHAMTYDTARQRVVLFGGESFGGVTYGDTWEWDGDSWTQVQDIGPTPRAFHALAYDGTRQRTVLFGGRAMAGLVGDTWEWDGENWTQVADSGPAGRSGHAIAYDVQRQRIVLFGGTAETRRNDTWEWDGDEWVQQGDSGPSPRAYSAMAYDSRRNRLVLFGGATEDQQSLGDTWEWDGTAWTEESAFGADPCAGGAMVFKGGRIALFGGVTSVDTPEAPPEFFNRSWEWDGKHWTARQDIGPGSRAFHAMAFDSARTRVVLFGGSSALPSAPTAAASVRGDTWEQFEAGRSAAAVSIASIQAPNPVISGGQFAVTVMLSGPAPSAVEVAVILAGEEVSRIPIGIGMASGSVNVDVAAAPGTDLDLTARLDGSEATIVLHVVGVAPVEIVSLEAVPNPATPGQIVVLTVTLASPVPENTPVLMLAAGQFFGQMLIAGGSVNGSLELPIDPGIDSVEIPVTARAASGSEVTIFLQIVP